MIILTMDQRSPEWHEARLGVITGSRVKNAFASNNLPFVDELIAEKLSGQAEMLRVNDAMQRGIDLEPLAMDEYSKYSGYEVQEVGFCIHDELDWLAVSPDGLIKDDSGEKYVGGIEIKCPNSKTHIGYIRTGKLPSAYKYQVHQYFHVCQDLEWVDFMSYDPRVVQKPCHFIRIYREDIKDDLDESMGNLLKFREKYEKYYNQILF